MSKANIDLIGVALMGHSGSLCTHNGFELPLLALSRQTERFIRHYETVYRTRGNEEFIQNLTAALIVSITHHNLDLIKFIMRKEPKLDVMAPIIGGGVVRAIPPNTFFEYVEIDIYREIVRFGARRTSMYVHRLLGKWTFSIMPDVQIG